MRRKKVFKGLFALVAAIAVLCSLNGTVACAEEECHHSLEHITKRVDGTGSSSWTRNHTIIFEDSDVPGVTYKLECVYFCRILVVNSYCDVCKKIVDTRYYTEERHQHPMCPWRHYEFDPTR